MNTLLLDRSTWDLCLTASGDIAVASDPYSISQDVCSAVRTFLGECWYDTALGVPYFAQILGRFPPLAVVKNLLANAASTVPGCFSPVVVVQSLSQSRVLTGQVQFKDSQGNAQVTTFSTQIPLVLGGSTLGRPRPGQI